MDNSIKLVRVFGIDIFLHFSWWFVFIILTWSLATGFFPHYYPNFTAKEYWLMGVVAALLLFVSVLLHELSHSLIARWKKIKVNSITLFFFGGVAGISKEDLSPKSEFLMAIAGPLFSLALAALCYGLYRWDGNYFVTAITFYLYQLNLILAVFNLVPGYPLDGGRAFRAILYGYYKDLKKATKIAAGAGKFVAGILFFMGLLAIIGGMANGLWFIFLGGFLYLIAGASYEQVVIKETLSPIKVKELIQTDFPILAPEMPLKEFAAKQARSGQRFFIVKNAQFQGMIDLHQLAPIPLEMQKKLRLKHLALSFSHLTSLENKTSAAAAFRMFLEQKVELLPVKENKTIVGYLTHEAVMNRLVAELKLTEPHHSRVAARIYRRRR